MKRRKTPDDAAGQQSGRPGRGSGGPIEADIAQGDALPFAAEELATCLTVLERLHRVEPDHPAFVAVERAAAHLRKSAKRKRRLARSKNRRGRDRQRTETTGRVAAYTAGAAHGSPSTEPGQPLDETAAVQAFERRRHCYVCKQPFRRIDGFYHALCPDCAASNRAARTDRVDLSGRRAVVTGGRIKIGFQTALKLLRDGAEVAITTRFPSDAARRFAACDDFPAWRERLSIHGLDFRYLPEVLSWIDRFVAEGRPLDILINNAAQTIWRPPAYYFDLIAGEDVAGLASPVRALLARTVDRRRARARGGVTLAPVDDGLPTLTGGDRRWFPPGRRDEEGRQLDLRSRNSWTLTLADVAPIELVEVMIVNAIVPFLFAGRLFPLLSRSRFDDRYIVNVSAMEGKFEYRNKTSRHPHTNMAKAALNMLTRTAAADYARRGIYMNSVDTGWVTQENPHPIKAELAARGFCPPLDDVDGAARVYAPIVHGVRGNPTAGLFYKDYQPTEW